MEKLPNLPSALWLICASAAGCSLYPDTAPVVDAAGGAGSGGTGATAGGGASGSGGAGGNSGAAQGGSGGVVCASPQTLELDAEADAFVASNQPATTHGAEDMLELSPNGSRRVVARFALASALGSASAIQSARLDLTVIENKDFAETLVAHRLTRVWDEGLVTWDTAEEGVSWTVPGGDFEILGSAATSVELTTGVGAKVSFDLTDEIRGFLDGTQNEGWLVKVNAQTGQNSDRLRFASRESARIDDRPKLVISFCP